MQVIDFVERKTGKTLYELAKMAGVNRQAVYRLRDANATLSVRVIAFLLGLLSPEDKMVALELLNSEPWPKKRKSRARRKKIRG